MHEAYDTRGRRGFLSALALIIRLHTPSGNINVNLARSCFFLFSQVACDDDMHYAPISSLVIVSSRCLAQPV